MKYIVSVKKEGVVAVSDENILDRKFTEGKLQLDLTKEFYKGEEKNSEEAKKLMAGAKHLHLTGKGAVALVVEMDLVDTERILFVDNVPHAEVLVE